MTSRMPLVLALAASMSMSTLAVAGPPLDGPSSSPPSSSSSRPPPPPLLSTPEAPRPRTWEEAHVWEERATFVGLVGGALLGATGTVLGLTALAASVADPTAPPPETRPEYAISMAVFGVYGGMLGAYVGGFVGAGVGTVIDAAAAPAPTGTLAAR